jgi:hypothetical protein
MSSFAHSAADGWLFGGLLIAGILIGPVVLRAYQNPAQPAARWTRALASRLPVSRILLVPALPTAGMLTVLLGRHPVLPLLALAYLTVSVLVGLLVTRWLFPALPALVYLCAGLLTGLLLTTWPAFLLALALARALDEPVLVAGIVTLWCGGLSVWVWRRHLAAIRMHFTRVELAVSGAALLFSGWLYGHALSYDTGRGLLVANGSWTDFDLHLGVARSFSWGSNLPPQHPWYAGPPIRYHFGLDFLAGLLERLGLRLDLAYNLPSVVGFTMLLVLLFELGRLLSGRTACGVFAAILMPLSSSLAFVDYLARWEHTPFGLIRGLWQQTERLHIGPYDNKVISSHFTLIPYIHQRHLALGMAAGILVILLVAGMACGRGRLTAVQMLALGAFLGLSFPLNGVIYLCTLSVTATILVLFRRWRLGTVLLATAVAVALPSALLLSGGSEISRHAGYLVEPLTVRNFLRYWWLNFGLLVPIAAGAALLGSSSLRRMLIAFSVPFVIGNLVQFSADDSGGVNHKLFNFWAALMAVLGGIALARLSRLRLPGIRRAGVVLVALLLPPLTLSGVIDVMLFKNEGHVAVIDDTGRPGVDWIAAHTAGDAVFLTASALAMPPSAAGRRLYIGYAAFAAVAGYDVGSRLTAIQHMYRAASRQEACERLRAAGIDYVQIGPAELQPDSPLQVNQDLWDQFTPAFEASTLSGPLRYYRVADNC